MPILQYFVFCCFGDDFSFDTAVSVCCVVAVDRSSLSTPTPLFLEPVVIDFAVPPSSSIMTSLFIEAMLA